MESGGATRSEQVQEAAAGAVSRPTLPACSGQCLRREAAHTADTHALPKQAAPAPRAHLDRQVSLMQRQQAAGVEHEAGVGGADAFVGQRRAAQHAGLDLGQLQQRHKHAAQPLLVTKLCTRACVCQQRGRPASRREAAHSA